MTTQTLRNPSAVADTGVMTAPRWLGTLATRFLAWRHAQRIINELVEYSDRQLADMGIARGDIANLARNDARAIYGV